MTLGRAPSARSRIWGITLVVSVATVVAMSAGQHELAEVTGGALAVWASVILGIHVTPLAASETDPGRVLKLDLLLVLIVALGLFGVALIGLAFR